MRDPRQVGDAGDPPTGDKGGTAGILQSVAGQPAHRGHLAAGRRVEPAAKAAAGIRSRAALGPLQDDVLQDVLQRVVA